MLLNESNDKATLPPYTLSGPSSMSTTYGTNASGFQHGVLPAPPPGIRPVEELLQGKFIPQTRIQWDGKYNKDISDAVSKM